jgi:hypothetical protein
MVWKLLGRSAAYRILEPFISEIDRRDLRRVVDLFQTNARVRSELFQTKPKARATELLATIRERFTLEAHRNEVDAVVESLEP